MKTFAHFNAKTIEDAVLIINRYGSKAAFMAGGTDLMGMMKDDILNRYPEAIINIKTIHGLDYIEEDNKTIRIGALTRLEDIAENEMVKAHAKALSEAAHRTASPHIREMGTIGGNICQDIRCWFYRHPNNRFPCLRKGGGRCYAIRGDSRFHSIFGGSVEEGCFAVHPSDTAPALIALKARIKTTKRTVEAENFFQVRVAKTTVLDDDEIVTEIEIPRPSSNTRSTFIKFAQRKTIDFAIVNCAVMIDRDDEKVSIARICLNSVYVKPYRAKEAEMAIIGKQIDEDAAEVASEAAVSHARPLKDNGYMVQIARTLVKRGILACG